MRTPWDWLELGIYFTRQGDLAAAEAVFEGLTAMAPDMPEAWFHLYRVLESRGRMAEAALARSRAIGLDPQWHRTLLSCWGEYGAAATKSR